MELSVKMWDGLIQDLFSKILKTKILKKAPNFYLSGTFANTISRSY